MENPNIRKPGQNLKYDAIVLRNVGLTLAGLAFDTMIASYLLDAGGRSHNLDDLAQRHRHLTWHELAAFIHRAFHDHHRPPTPATQAHALPPGADTATPRRTDT